MTNPTELQSLIQPSKYEPNLDIVKVNRSIHGVTTEKSEILVYEKELYDSVIRVTFDFTEMFDFCYRNSHQPQPIQR